MKMRAKTFEKGIRTTCLSCAALCLALSGCSSSGNAKLLDASLIDRIRSHSTTQEQVRQMIGSPAIETSMLVNGQTVASWSYSYRHRWINPLMFVPVINLVIIACCQISESEFRSLTVSFTPDGKVNQKVLNRQSHPAPTD